MSAWVASRVGPTGRVVAVDADVTDELRAVRLPRLEVERCDLRTDELPGGPFSLVYARLVLGYIGDRVVPRLTARLCRGGTLVIEDYDWYAARTSSDPLNTALASYRRLLESIGLDPRFGTRLQGILRRAGLDALGTCARTRRGDTSGPVGRLFRRTLDTAAPALLDRALITRRELRAALRAIEDPATELETPALVACWGRRWR